MLTSGFQNCQISELIFRGQNVYGSTRLDKRNTIVLDLLLYHEKQGSYWQKTIRLRRLLSVRPVAKIAAVSTPVLLTPWSRHLCYKVFKLLRLLNIEENFKALFYHSLTELKWNTLTLKAGPLPGYMKVTWLSKISWRTAEAGPHHPRPYFAAVRNVSRSWQWFCSKMPLTLTSRFMESWLVEVIDSIVAVVYVFVYSVVKCVWGAADNMS